MRRAQYKGIGQGYQWEPIGAAKRQKGEKTTLGGQIAGGQKRIEGIPRLHGGGEMGNGKKGITGGGQAKVVGVDKDPKASK